MNQKNNTAKFSLTLYSNEVEYENFLFLFCLNNIILISSLLSNKTTSEGKYYPHLQKDMSTYFIASTNHSSENSR
jgi:hypothetical protein